MDIRIYIFAIIIIVGLFLRNSGDTKRNRNRFIDIILVVLILESCLRGLSVGTDTYKYSGMFEDAALTSWSEAFTIMHDRYIDNVDDIDAGYLVFEKIVQIFTNNFQLFLLVCALCFFLPFRKLLRWADLSIDNLILLFVLYVALFNPIAMSGIRKEIALGFSILFFLYYIDKEYVKAVIWLLLGMVIHMSILIILLFPVIDFLAPKIKKIVHGVSFSFIPLVIVFSTSILFFMATFIGNERYTLYAQNPEGGGITFVALIEIIFLGCLLYFKVDDLKANSKLNHLYSMLPMATVLVPLITNNGSMIRISQYFHLYVLILLPMLVNKISGKETSVVLRIVLIVILIVMCLNTGMLGSEYYFFWENVAPEY